VVDCSTVVCAVCGQESPAGFRFCGRCGAPLAGEASAEVRKTVSVVFCDLVGSTALGERTDPELLREVMGRYHAELRTILERHGGTVEKFVGDAAMSVFGLPRVHEDDALRAVRAAVEMRDAVTSLGLEVRIGVNTGEVVAGAGETLVTGDAVNVAARLEQAAGAGEILVGAATERLVRDGVRVEPVDSLSLKGKSEPVSAYRVLEVLDLVPAFTRPIASPFVGRERELDLLEGALATALETRSPQLATIVGPPGIGKSRLVRELLGRTGTHVLVGRCLSYGEGITYLPLSEIVSQIGDPEKALMGSVDADLAALRIGVALGTASATGSSEEIAWGFRKLFEALAQERPLIVVFDDIHWAEPTLLDLIEYVATFARDIPLLLLCTARPDLFETRPAWTTPKPNTTLITLEPLAGGECETLVGQLGELPQDVRARIVEAAEGNPLFVEQLVAMQAEAGNGELHVPPSLQALLAARIDRLAEEERAVIERGSVEGRLFHRGAVVELLAERERGAAGSHLLTLVRKELIRPDHATIPGDDGFRFGHILIRDAAYDAIPKRQRAILHERYAEWLSERLGDEAPDEILGYHLEQAYRYMAELEAIDAALGERAAARLAAAARAARTRQDAAAAVNLLSRASALVPKAALRGSLLADLGLALTEVGQLDRARELFEEAVELARAADDDHVQWLARLQLAYLRIRQQPEGAAEDAFREGEAAIAACKATGDHEVLARAWHLIAEGHLLRAQAVEQTRAIEQAVEHARQAGDLALEVELVPQSAPPIIFGSVPVEDGLRYADNVLQRLGHIPAIQAFALHVIAHLRARLGEFDKAYEALDEWRTSYRELGLVKQYAITSGCVWDVCSWAGDWERGEQALREGCDLLEQMGDKSFLSTAAAYLGEALYRQGQFDEAERQSRISEELGSSDDRLNEASWRALRAKVLAARGELGPAEALAREAVAIAETTDYFEVAAGAWLDLAEILHASGNTRDTALAAQEALTRYEEKGNLVGSLRATKLLHLGDTPSQPISH
jgi:predicted ATPase/class 3 adenylate cyclase